jgi:hypothetical protein
LQRRAKPSSQRQRSGSGRGLTYSGASRRSIQCSARHGMPGTVSGIAWLGVRVPQLPCEAPQPGSPRSTTRTVAPRRSKVSAQNKPITPPPRIRTSLRASLIPTIVASMRRAPKGALVPCRVRTTDRPTGQAARGSAAT